MMTNQEIEQKISELKVEYVQIQNDIEKLESFNQPVEKLEGKLQEIEKELAYYHSIEK
ncbi:SE1832 family protein [Robertmurraya sp. P23]|uniref:SE1832 family protein n=1 Tax=Robertmurraya sp. P23 TaxID=3436931 RepID=UPI003D96DAC4